MRKKRKLDGSWFFIESKTYDNLHEVDSKAVTIPHTYTTSADNWEDKQATYTYSFEAIILDKEYYIEFLGVSISCDLYINGKFVGNHFGGYQTFRFKVTDFLVNGSNEIRVFVSNQHKDLVYPCNTVDIIYGGIIRDVYLIETEKYHFSLLDYGSSGIYLDTTFLDTQAAKVGVKCLNNCPNSFFIDYFVFDMEKNIVKQGRSEKNNFEIEINNPHAWNGKENPYLYEFKFALNYEKNVVDEVIIKYGIRRFQLKNKSLYLNDRKVYFKGLNLEDWTHNKGPALDEEDIYATMSLINEIGPNCLHFLNHQANPLFYDLADENGYLVWTEIPFREYFVNAKDTNNNVKNQLKELILQSYNHPSVVLYGIQSQILKTGSNSDVLNLIKEMAFLAKELDPNRFTIQTHFILTSIRNESMQLTDFNSFAIPFGWQCGNYKDISDWIEMYSNASNKPLLIASYGAEGDIRYHSSMPKCGDYSEEFQALYHEEVVEVLNNSELIEGYFVNRLYDKPNKTGEHYYGFVSQDGNIKKDVFYFYKSQWSNPRFVHLCGSRFRIRNDKIIGLKIYTNQDFISCFVNNNEKSGVVHHGVCIIENIELHEGENHIEAKLDQVKDSMIIQYTDSTVMEYIKEKSSIPPFLEFEKSEGGQKYSIKNTWKELEREPEIKKVLQGKYPSFYDEPRRHHLENYPFEMTAKYLDEFNETELAVVDRFFQTYNFPD